MHILHISPYMAWGGTERCISNLISQSLKNGCRASLLCPEGDGLKRIPPGVPVYTLKNWTILRPLNAISELKERALSIGKSVDLIQVHAAAEMAHVVKKYLPQKPVIFTCHGYDNELPPYINYWLASRFLRKVDLLVVLNPLDRGYFVRAGIKKGKIALVPNGVEQKFFNHWSKQAPDNHQVVGVVGRLVKQKNPRWVLKAQAHYQFATQVVIVGDGPLRSKLESLAGKLGVKEHVHFLGRKDNMEEIYPLFSYLLVCSRNEACPLVILESLASGTPVFIPRWLPGLVNLWKGTPGVFVFESGHCLKRQIEKNMGAAEREKIRNSARLFLWENVFKRYKELYLKVLNGNSI